MFALEMLLTRGMQKGKKFTVGEITSACIYMAVKRAEQRHRIGIMGKELFAQMIN